jgi:hypothetical protein
MQLTLTQSSILCQRRATRTPLSSCSSSGTTWYVRQRFILATKTNVYFRPSGHRPRLSPLPRRLPPLLSPPLMRPRPRPLSPLLRPRHK